MILIFSFILVCSVFVLKVFFFVFSMLKIVRIVKLVKVIKYMVVISINWSCFFFCVIVVGVDGGLGFEFVGVILFVIIVKDIYNLLEKKIRVFIK